MSLRKAYRGARFVAAEPGAYLKPWNRPVQWEPNGEGLFGASKGILSWFQNVDGSIAEVIAYLDWLNHRNPYRPYWMRRLCLPNGLILGLIDRLLTQQEQLPDMSFDVPEELAWTYLEQQAVHLDGLEKVFGKTSIGMPLMRVYRLHSTVFKLRERFYAEVSEAGGQLFGYGNQITMNVGLEILGLSHFAPASLLRKLYARQRDIEAKIRSAFEERSRA
ncbi:MAG: hypothetical protein ACPGN3_02610 [Opitutales bacterium]